MPHLRCKGLVLGYCASWIAISASNLMVSSSTPKISAVWAFVNPCRKQQRRTAHRRSKVPGRILPSP